MLAFDWAIRTGDSLRREELSHCVFQTTNCIWNCNLAFLTDMWTNIEETNEINDFFLLITSSNWQSKQQNNHQENNKY